MIDEGWPRRDAQVTQMVLRGESMNPGMYISYNSIHSSQWTESLNELCHHLSQYNLESLIVDLAKINVMLSTDEDGNMRRRLVSHYLSPNIMARLQEFLNRPDLPTSKTTVFHKQQLLCLIKLAIMNCTPGTRINLTQRDHWQVGEICLKLNDTIRPELQVEETDTNDRLLLNLVRILPAYELGHKPCLWRRISRSYDLFIKEIPNIRITRTNICFDIAEWFKKCYNFSLDKWQAMVFAIYGVLTEHLYYPRIDIPCVGNLSNIFRNCAIDQATINSCISLLITDISSMRRQLLKQDTQYFYMDFNSFRGRPLLSVGSDVFTCLDIDFLVDKLYVGLFWEYHDSLGNEEKDLLHEAFGLAFDNYMESRFNQLFRDQGGQTITCGRIKKTNGEEVCDYLVCVNSTLFLFEFKTSPLNADAKYSYSVEKLRSDLDRKYVQNERGKAKAVRQLVNAIKYVGSEDGRELLSGKGIDLGGIKRIIPIIVTFDECLGLGLVRCYLDRKFWEHYEMVGCPQEIVVSELVLLTVEDVEVLESLHLSGRSLFQEIMDYLEYIGRNRISGFNDYLAQNYNQVEIPTNERLDNISRSLAESWREILFPGQS
ncbi:MAG: hypothetical protein HYY96_14230 [Candidatus Tectomicrobia bacterium]|nr:hypothetical protein [Candidatus Tectomicrobia bacterium]